MVPRHTSVTKRPELPSAFFFNAGRDSTGAISATNDRRDVDGLIFDGRDPRQKREALRGIAKRKARVAQDITADIHYCREGTTGVWDWTLNYCILILYK